jgi:hypothetical protein
MECLLRLGARDVCMECKLVDLDIEKYIDHQLMMNDDLNQWGKEVHNDIKSTLMAGAEGMYGHLHTKFTLLALTYSQVPISCNTAERVAVLL